MQHLIETILMSKILSDTERATSLFMEDDKKEYHVFAWTKDDSVLQFGYGHGESYLDYKPEGNENSELTIHFPYTDLSEKEAYILFCYEKLKFKKFGFTTLDRVGFSDDFSF